MMKITAWEYQLNSLADYFSTLRHQLAVSRLELQGMSEEEAEAELARRAKERYEKWIEETKRYEKEKIRPAMTVMLISFAVSLFFLLAVVILCTLYSNTTDWWARGINNWAVGVMILSLMSLLVFGISGIVTIDRFLNRPRE